MELAIYASIITPVAHFIKTLKGQVPNAADVYIFWLTIVASLWN